MPDLIQVERRSGCARCLDRRATVSHDQGKTITMTDTLEAEKFTIHNSAAALILAAAKTSGLLEDVAAVLCAFGQIPDTGATCRVCRLWEDLADAFDGVCPSTWEDIYGEGSCTPWTLSKEEIAPYMVTPMPLGDRPLT
jgi:hypothetical protein